jgi:hypothetical protein
MSTLTHTVRLSMSATWTDEGTWTFSKTGASGAEAVEGALQTASAAQVLEFDVTWAGDPTAGDDVTVEYDGDGDIYKTGGDSTDDKMEASGVFPITNCEGDLPGPSTGVSISPTGGTLFWNNDMLTQERMRSPFRSGIRRNPQRY